MQKDAIHHGGWEHRDVHNINGMLFQNLTSVGLIEREEVPKRPFVLTRAYYAGSQRYGAAWTGDNLGDWPHLASTVPMLLSNGISGMVFIGSDVGGFFGNPPPEMMTRWYQIGTFSPFFRGHGHIDTKRREPYLFEQPYQGIMRDAIRMRYSIMPAFYTAFFDASRTGMPILRPQYVVFPNDPKGFALDDQFYLGDSGLLVKPVAREGQTEQEMYISDDQASDASSAALPELPADEYAPVSSLTTTTSRTLSTLEPPMTARPSRSQRRSNRSRSFTEVVTSCRVGISCAGLLSSCGAIRSHSSLPPTSPGRPPQVRCTLTTARRSTMPRATLSTDRSSCNRIRATRRRLSSSATAPRAGTTR